MAITIDGTNGLSSDNAALKLDGTTLAVDETNNRVGVGTASPAVAMDVVGQVRASTGILFGSDTAAANALDDYEEGTFTPNIIGTSTDGTASYAVRVARYTKIGNRVFFNLYVEWSGGTGTGFLQLNGLPFTANSTSNNLPVATTHLGNVALSANNIGWSYVINGTDKFNISQMPTGGGAAGNVSYDAAGAMLLAGHYEV